MKSNEQIRQAAKLAAENIANELNNGGGTTLQSLSRLETNARVCEASINQLKQRNLGADRENEA
jgi:hypothetical protein